MCHCAWRTRAALWRVAPNDVRQRNVDIVAALVGAHEVVVVHADNRGHASVVADTRDYIGHHLIRRVDSGVAAVDRPRQLSEMRR